MLEHVAVWARDPDEVTEFYCRFLGATAGPRFDNPTTGCTSRFLTWPAGGGRIEVLSAPDVQRPGAARRGWAHVALSLGSGEAVAAACERMTAAGIRVVERPGHSGDGTYGCVVLDPEGNRIELVP